MRAILTFSRGWNALTAARSLGRRGIEVIAGDEYAFSPTSFSKYTIASFSYPSPDRDPEGLLAVSDVWSWHDPLPALGVLYPLAVFLKNGKVSTELLVSEEPLPATT